MANYVKSNVRFTPVVEEINRKWAPRKKTCSASKKIGPVETESQSWMGSATLKIARAGIEGARKNYFVFRENARQSAASARELLIRGAMEAGNAWKVLALKDLMAISTNQARYLVCANNPAAYIEVGDGERLYAKGYSMPGFVAAYAIKQYLYNGTLPQDHLIPTPVVPA